ncbi:MAG: ArsA family ATPase [Deltaproteobacteria bacterium]|nr:ArsA family ATPase [Deltaproteobacteria bacterium]
MNAPPAQQRFVIVAGKGGVGKSTLCAALGLLSARSGLRTLIVELNARQKAPGLFGKEPAGYEVQELEPGLFALAIQPEPALHEYALRKVRFERVYRTIFQNEAVKRLLAMVPGMTELLLLGKAFDLEREEERGEPVWDRIIIDSPATGHGVSLLRLPSAILGVIERGPMADEVRAMRDLLVDPARTRIHLVTLPEEMPVRETFDLLEQIDTLLEIPKGWLFINGVWPEVLDTDDEEVLRLFRSTAHGQDPVVDAAVERAERMAERRRFQETYLAELARGVDMPQVQVPYLFVPEFGREAVHTLADHIARELERMGSTR